MSLTVSLVTDDGPTIRSDSDKARSSTLVRADDRDRHDICLGIARLITRDPPADQIVPQAAVLSPTDELGCRNIEHLNLAFRVQRKQPTLPRINHQTLDSLAIFPRQPHVMLEHTQHSLLEESIVGIQVDRLPLERLVIPTLVPLPKNQRLSDE